MTSGRSFYTPGHEFEGLLGHSEDVGVHGAHVLPAVHLYELIAVDRELLVRIDSDQHDPTVSVDTVTLQEPHV
jgi:hypothetical protein